MTDPKTKGEITEHIVKAELVRRGVTVLEPTQENLRYDFVAEDGDEFYKLQCKLASYKGDSIMFEVSSYQANNTSGEHKDYKGEVDHFVVYCSETEQCYIIPEESVGSRTKTLRLERPKNNQMKGITMAGDYTFDEVFGRELV